VFWGNNSNDVFRYIHANYRFVVNPSGNYRAQAIDADVPLDWNNVLQILASAESQLSSCPICLSHPVAPRMAKCGHIFCLPCLIRYMHSTDDDALVPEKKARWKKCPLCWDSIYISDTRPVRWFTGQENPAPREGEDVILRLVMRRPGSTLALPRDGAEEIGNLEDIPWYFAAEVTDYARVMKGSEEYMTSQYDAEIEDLKCQEQEDELMFGEDAQWTKKAVNAVKEAKTKIVGIGNPPDASELSEQRARRQATQSSAFTEPIPESWEAVADEEKTIASAGLIEAASIPSEQPSIHTSKPEPAAEEPVKSAFGPPELSTRRPHAPDGHPPDSPYYFYQALLHYYLAPLDIRILKAAFGNFAAFPATLLPRVERVSTGHIVDDDLRKRTKYLAHLPYGCEVGFLECDWTDVVGPEILEKFGPEIERRRQKNKEKENREEKARIRAEKIGDDERWAATRRKSPAYAENKFSDGDFQPLAAHDLDSTGGSPPYPVRQGSAFASLASPSTSPGTQRTVWGTTLIPSTAPELSAQHHVDSSGDDGWLQDWDKELDAENALIAQVQAASLNGEGSASVSAAPHSQGGKKKKKQKITLMSTTARRAA
jgi:hypothetical protein